MAGDPTDDSEQTRLLETATVPATGPGPGIRPGTVLGRYRIDSLLGSGGMGEVYRAEQLQPIRRTVALKLLRRERLSGNALIQFELERQVLAQMRHPAIAQIFDADTTDDGHPYFAMEYIEGASLTEYCQRAGLDLRQRLALFIRVCEGVQHAHQKGIVHRDLKPANVLVTDVDNRPRPKIIDFGIATGDNDTGAAHAGTPEYMSPEQVGHEPGGLDTRSDVYSLGVMLYELLTGVRPQAVGETVTGSTHTLRLPSERVRTLPPEEVARMAEQVGLSLTRMGRVFREDLDWVVAKAMAHRREERYPTAAALAEDLQRHLDAHPVLAAPQHRSYVLRKYVQRNRGLVLAASAVVLALLGGLGLSLYGLQQAREQRSIAEQRSAELEKVASFQQSMLEDVDVQAMGLGIAHALREQAARDGGADAQALGAALDGMDMVDLSRGLLDANLLQAADAAIARDFGNEPALAATLAESVANVRRALGLYTRAAQDFETLAKATAQREGEGSPAVLALRDKQLQALLAARDEAAAHALSKAIQPQVQALPANNRLRLQLELDAAMALGGIGQREPALAALRDLQQRATAALGAEDALTEQIIGDQATWLARTGHPGQGRELLEPVFAAREKRLGPDDAKTLALMQQLAVMRVMSGERESAIAMQTQLVQRSTAQSGAEHPVTLSARHNLATMLMDAGKFDEALAMRLPLLEVQRRVLGEEHAATVSSLLNLSSLYARMQRHDEALALQRKIIEIRTRRLGPEHPDTLFIRTNEVATTQQSGRNQQALALAADVLPLARRVLGEDHPQVQMVVDLSASAWLALGQPERALPLLRELLTSRERNPGKDDRRTLATAERLAEVLRSTGNAAEAARLDAQWKPVAAAASD